MSDRTPLPLGVNEIKVNVTFQGPRESEKSERIEDAVRAYFAAAGFRHVDELIERFSVAYATELGEAVAECTTEIAEERDRLREAITYMLEAWDCHEPAAGIARLRDVMKEAIDEEN